MEEDRGIGEHRRGRMRETKDCCGAGRRSQPHSAAERPVHSREQCNAGFHPAKVVHICSSVHRTRTADRVTRVATLDGLVEQRIGRHRAGTKGNQTGNPHMQLHDK